jgi:hypothetical protein
VGESSFSHLSEVPVAAGVVCFDVAQLRRIALVGELREERPSRGSLGSSL